MLTLLLSEWPKLQRCVLVKYFEIYRKYLEIDILITGTNFNPIPAKMFFPKILSVYYICCIIVYFLGEKMKILI